MDATDGDGPVADLHVHTTASDGVLELDEVPAVAREAGLECVALTDHDRYHPGLDAPTTTREGVTLVRGIELRVDAGSRQSPRADARSAPAEAGDLQVDLLGYGLAPTPALEDLLDRIQRDRIGRAGEIIDQVEDRLGVRLDLEPRRGIGRPHVARAVAESEAPYDYQGAFDHLIGDGCPCYVAREIPSFERGREVLAEACALVGLAHPLRYPVPEAALALAADLDAVERYYPYDPPVDDGAVVRVIEERDLLATGGSDAHDRRLGTAGPPRAAFDRFARRLDL
ncbi:MAG: PHP domain-containing protein [Salinigranum sp.]